jgi:hypothetical protein
MRYDMTRTMKSAVVVLALSASGLRAQVSTPPVDSALIARPVGDSLAPLTPAPVPRDPARQSRLLMQPTVTSFTFGEGSTARTVEQAAVPVVLVLPFHRRFTVDVTSAAAYTRVVANDSTESEIFGTTDTQIRADWQLMLDHLSLTLGVNAPSGQYRVTDDQIGAAALIGNDFLMFPIASMGNGPAGTVGLAAAVQLFNINVGFGGSYRKGMEFEPVSSEVGEVRYLPADETRLRLSAERRLWIGTASFGMIFSTFGEEQLDATTYSTGDRVITTAGWSIPLGRLQVDLGLWNIDRDAGERFGVPAPAEAIRNYSGAVSLRLGQWVFQPMMESRRATVSGDRVAELSNAGITVSIPMGQRYVLEPRYVKSTGEFSFATSDGKLPMTGWQGSLLLRRR